MRWFIVCLFCLGSLAVPVEAVEGRILKVLPHFLDHEGRHTLAPSLYERDAYQAILRNRPEERGGLRFDVHWNVRGKTAETLTLKVEMRGMKQNEPTAHAIEAVVERRRWLATWSDLVLTGPDYEQLGELNAWRVTLWHGERQIAEQMSFLWQRR